MYLEYLISILMCWVMWIKANHRENTCPFRIVGKAQADGHWWVKWCCRSSLSKDHQRRLTRPLTPVETPAGLVSWTLSLHKDTQAIRVMAWVGIGLTFDAGGRVFWATKTSDMAVRGYGNNQDLFWDAVFRLAGLYLASSIVAHEVLWLDLWQNKSTDKTQEFWLQH